MTPADGICFDYMPGLRAGFSLAGCARRWVPTVAAADGDLALESDEPATTSLLDAIPGYGRLRGF